MQFAATAPTDGAILVRIRVRDSPILGSAERAGGCGRRPWLAAADETVAGEAARLTPAARCASRGASRA
eukprot:6207775-Pleurochrysis_carterae.AAC.2